MHYVIAGSKFVSSSAEQKILKFGVSKESLSKIYILPWKITNEIELCMYS